MGTIASADHVVGAEYEGHVKNIPELLIRANLNRDETSLKFQHDMLAVMAPNKDVYKDIQKKSKQSKISPDSHTLESPHLQHALSSDHRNNIQLGARPSFP